jgi:hypothetical protein
MACAGQTGGLGQVSGYSSRTTSVLQSLGDFSRPWNKNTPKTQPARKENPTQSLENNSKQTKNCLEAPQPKDTRVK